MKKTARIPSSSDMVPVAAPLFSKLAEMTAMARDGRCPCCGKPTHHTPFTDKLSKEEARISGLCQPCQDRVFN